MDNLIKSVERDEPWYLSLLVCPDCHTKFDIDSGFICQNCEFSAPYGRDLRARHPRSLAVDFPRGPSFNLENLFQEIKLNRPKLNYDGPLAVRDSREFMSIMSLLLPEGSQVLDLGCGPRDQAVPITHLGHSYVGFDYTNQNADFLADAHSIPFMNESFDCVFSYSVFEHLHNPYVALQEVARVLKPGGFFIGAVSQGEPFHQSYFHFTPWGMAALVSSAPSLMITDLWPSMDTLQSLSRIGRYPRVIRWLIKQIDFLHRKLPFLAPRKAKWSPKEKAIDELYRSSSLCFCVKKSQKG